MRWMRALGLNVKTATMAKDRLQIIIAQQRSESTNPDYLPALRKEILEIVAKYTKVKSTDVHVDLHSKDNNSVLELNVTLPSELENNAKEKEVETV
jgi:cell division topological specificity factor